MEMERLGQELKTARYILVSNKKFMHTIPPQLKMFGYNVWVCQNTPAEIGAEGLVWVLDSSNDLACLTRSGTGSVIVNAMSLTMGSNRRFDCDFEEIAQRSKGVPRLGMLRMDVDNLGAIFYRGLKHYRHMKGEPKRFYSLARITTLSSQLAAFFCDILPRDIERNTDWNKRVTVVYAGGDDLFLLGAWDALPEIALFIQERFKDYCCRNPAFSLSGGMVVTHGRFPIYKSAEMAGTAEQVAKAHQTKFDDRTIQEKNAFTLFDTPMHWREFSTVHDMVKSLKDFMQQPSGRPLLNRLRAIAASWHSSKWQLLRNSNCVKMDDIRKQLDAEKWRWQSVYAMCRIVEGHQNLKSIISDLQAFICNPVSHTNRSGIELLGMLCQWLELLYRNVQVRKGE
jgi:CRISPR-associated protein Csm1